MARKPSWYAACEPEHRQGINDDDGQTSSMPF